MNQITTKDRLSNNKSITDSKPIMLFKDLIRPVLSLIAGFRVPYQVIIEQPCRLLPDKPVIYAVNHSCFADTPIMGRITSQRSYILLGKQRLGFSDWAITKCRMKRLSLSSLMTILFIFTGKRRRDNFGERAYI